MPYYLDVEATDQLQKCHDCGGVVVDTDAHDEWHTDVEDQVRKFVKPQYIL